MNPEFLRIFAGIVICIVGPLWFATGIQLLASYLDEKHREAK